MKANARSQKEVRVMNPSRPVTIMALLAAMARCLNQNIAKVKIAPIDPAFTGSLAAPAALPPSQSAQA